MTQALSTRLKLSLDPLVYAYDTPGVMLPYLGRGLEGAERGVKLALIGMWNERISRTGVTLFLFAPCSWHQRGAVRHRSSGRLSLVSTEYD
jgi:hypothetical protein